MNSKLDKVSITGWNFAGFPIHPAISHKSFVNNYFFQISTRTDTQLSLEVSLWF